MSPNIVYFKGKYEFLSNFYPSPIPWTAGTFICPTVEHYYQASKAETPLCASYVLEAPTPGEAKKRGRKIKLREDWSDIDIGVMSKALIKKFDIPDLQDQLLATGDVKLIEGNWWHDNYWGDCKCNGCENTPGRNYLGTLLMALRSVIREGYKFV